MEKGAHHSEETKKKMSKARRGSKNGMYGKHHTPEARKKMAIVRQLYRREKHPNWQGGITPIEKIIRYLPEYFEWRDQLFKRDQWLCQKCFSWEELETHHKKNFSMILKENRIKTIEDALMCEELWTLENGITLCASCHNQIPKRIKERKI